MKANCWSPNNLNSIYLFITWTIIHPPNPKLCGSKDHVLKWGYSHGNHPYLHLVDRLLELIKLMLRCERLKLDVCDLALLLSELTTKLVDGVLALLGIIDTERGREHQSMLSELGDKKLRGGDYVEIEPVFQKSSESPLLWFQTNKI